MSLKDQSTLRIVLYEGDGAQPLEAADRFAAMSALLEKGFAVTRVAGGGRVAPADRTALLVLIESHAGIGSWLASHRKVTTTILKSSMPVGCGWGEKANPKPIWSSRSAASTDML